MKTNTISAVLLIVLVLTACTPANTALAPAQLPAATATAVPATERPHNVLGQDTVLFGGPGNVDFDPLATLKAGDTVFPLATYADFIEVETNVGGKKLVGFVHNKDLGNLPSGLPVLAADSVPLTPFFTQRCPGGVYDTVLGTQTFKTGDNGDTPIQVDSPIPLNAPLRLRLDSMSFTGDPGSTFRLYGHLGNSNSFLDGLITLGIGSKDGKYVLDILDGSGGQYNSGDLGLDITGPIQIVFEQIDGKSFQVLDGKGALIRRVDLAQAGSLKLPDGLFPDQQFYLAPSLPAHSSLTVTGLQIGTTATGLWVANAAPLPGLADLAAKHNLTIGTEFSMKENSDARYCHTIHRDFNLVFLGALDPIWYWRGPGQYDFSETDKELDYVLEQGWKVRGDIVYGSGAMPAWLKDGRFTRDQYIQMLEDLVKTAVGRYKGRVIEWSIANEAISRSCGPCRGGTDFWNEKIGPDYVEMAFRWAREADPNATLIWNDTNNEAPRDTQTSAVFDRMYARVKDLKSRAVPIDGVGMQMHLLLGYSSPIVPKKEDVLATMRKFAELGVKIYITEFDVDLHSQPGTPEQRLQFEADLYRAMLEACLESNDCASFSTWGVADATSWITQVCSDKSCINHADGAPLMFDNNYDPKPAYFAVRDVLMGDSSSNSP